MFPKRFCRDTYTTWPKVCGHPNKSYIQHESAAITASTLLVSLFSPQFETWLQGFAHVTSEVPVMMMMMFPFFHNKLGKVVFTKLFTQSTL